MMRSLVWQVREGYTFTSVASPSNPTVFLNGEQHYGGSAGFGPWQLACGSKAELTADTYAAARAALMSFRSDGGRVLGINPTTLVVPPALEKDAMLVVNTDIPDDGGSNPWKNTAELIVTPFLTGRARMMYFCASPTGCNSRRPAIWWHAMVDGSSRTRRKWS